MGLQWGLIFDRLKVSVHPRAGLARTSRRADGVCRYRRCRARTRSLLAAIVLALLSGCASGGSSSSTSSSTTAPAISTTASYQSSSTTTTTPGSQRASLGPLQTVEHYWRAIASQNFEAAYRDLVPGAVSQSESTFVSQEQQSQIQSAKFSGSLTSASKTAATVAVDSLTTTDGQYGCRTWTGSYQMTRLNGRWRIARASITPSPCRHEHQQHRQHRHHRQHQQHGTGSTQHHQHHRHHRHHRHQHRWMLPPYRLGGLLRTRRVLPGL